MIEPKNSLKYDFAKTCDASASADLSLIMQDKISTNTPLSIVSDEATSGHFSDTTLSKQQFPAQSLDHPNENVLKESSTDNCVTQKIKDLRSNFKESCSNFTKSGNITRSQSANSRSISNSLEDCVEVQEYFQEEEIGEDNITKGIANNDRKDKCMSPNVSQSQELQQGFRILNEILSDSNKHLNWPFIEPVDSTQDGCQDYYEMIETPMWLSKMKDKFLRMEYSDITEFVSDMRLMIDNCLVFNGEDHSISKKAKKLETVLTQKVALLSRDLRDRINEAVPPRNPLIATETLEQMPSRVTKKGKDSRRKMRELQKQRMLEKKLMFDHFVSTLQSWDENLFDHVTRSQMKAMWELPQLGLFLFLCSRPLNLNISQYELERCFVLSRQSSAMQRLMTSLFSSANQRSKLHLGGNLMTNKVWEEKMKDHISPWFKSLSDSNYDICGVSEKLAIDEQFFKIMGYNNPLVTKSYHDLTYYQKVWIVKSVCDHLLNIQKSLLDAIEKQDIIDLRPRELGVDKEGNTFFYFSQFCGDDVRIYKQSPLPTVEIGPIEFNYDDDVSYYSKKRSKKQSKKRPRKVLVVEDDCKTRTRDSRLRQNPRQLKNYQVDQSESSRSESESDSEDEKEADDSHQIKPKRNNISLNDKNMSVNAECGNAKARKSTRGTLDSADNKSMTLSSEQEENLESDWSFTAAMPRRSERKIIEESKKNATPVNKNKTNAPSENTEKSTKKRTNRNDWKDLAPFLPERNLRSKKQLLSGAEGANDRTGKISDKSRKKKVKEEKCEDEVKTEIGGDDDDGLTKEVRDVLSTPSEAVSLDSSELTEVKNYDTSEEADNDSSEDFKGDAKESGIEYELDETKMDVDEEDSPCLSFEPTIYGPNLEEFELVAESIQDIRNLVESIKKRAENEVDLNISCQSKNGTKKNSEKVLLENLDYLLKDLEPHETKLAQMLKKTRMQMRKEAEAYNEIPDTPDEETMDESSAREPSSPGDSQSNEMESESKTVESTNSLHDKTETKKKNIFENDIDMALLLTEGRVLRKRNNVQPQLPLATTRSKRLLNRPQRYKCDDYLTDDSIMASACNVEVPSVTKKSEEFLQAATSGTFTSTSSQLLKDPNLQIKDDRIVAISSINLIDLTKHNALPCTSTVTESMANLAEVSTVYSSSVKSPHFQTSVIPSTASNIRGPSLNSLSVLPQSVSDISTFLALTDQAIMSSKTPPTLKSSTASSHISNMALSPQTNTKSRPSTNVPSVFIQKPGTQQLSYNPTSFNPSKILNNPHSSLSLVNLSPCNPGTPGLIILPKNVSLSQSPLQKAISQSFIPSMPVQNLSASSGNKSIQLCPITSSMVINFQNVLPISNSSINISNHIVKPQNTFVAISSGSPSLKTSRPVNISSLPLSSRVLIPLKAQVSGNYAPVHSARPSQPIQKVAGLIPIVNSPGTSHAAANMQANMNCLPLQVGQLNCENGQSILLLANNSFTPLPAKPQLKTAIPFQLPASVNSNLTSYNRSSISISESQSQERNINESIVQQLVFDSLSNSSMPHQLIGPGLIPVSPAQVNSSIRVPASPSSLNIPVLLNKEVLRVLAQPQKPIQFNQVTSQGK